VRNGVASLPWAEQRSIRINADTRVVQFGINDRAAYNEEELRAAISERFSKDMTVKEIRDVGK
jgi:hypothetical protein